MQVIINIDDVVYETIKNNWIIMSGLRSGKVFLSKVFDAIENGVPIPKGHGTIKDVSQIEIPMCEDRAYEKWVQVAINCAPTIIEEDKKESER